MEKNILISETSKETRIAMVENGELVEFFVEKPEKTRMVGNIYKGVVENVVEGIQAAFVDIGYSYNAFLPFSEIGNPSSVTSMLESISHEEENANDELLKHKGEKQELEEID
jgi:ribonuclease G